MPVNSNDEIYNAIMARLARIENLIAKENQPAPLPPSQ